MFLFTVVEMAPFVSAIDICRNHLAGKAEEYSRQTLLKLGGFLALYLALILGIAATFVYQFLSITLPVFGILSTLCAVVAAMLFAGFVRPYYLLYLLQTVIHTFTDCILPNVRLYLFLRSVDQLDPSAPLSTLIAVHCVLYLVSCQVGKDAFESYVAFRPVVARKSTEIVLTLVLFLLGDEGRLGVDTMRKALIVSVRVLDLVVELSWMEMLSVLAVFGDNLLEFFRGPALDIWPGITFAGGQFLAAFSQVPGSATIGAVACVRIASPLIACGTLVCEMIKWSNPSVMLDQTLANAATGASVADDLLGPENAAPNATPTNLSGFEFPLVSFFASLLVLLVAGAHEWSKFLYLKSNSSLHILAYLTGMGVFLDIDALLNDLHSSVAEILNCILMKLKSACNILTAPIMSFFKALPDLPAPNPAPDPAPTTASCTTGEGPSRYEDVETTPEERELQNNVPLILDGDFVIALIGPVNNGKTSSIKALCRRANLDERISAGLVPSTNPGSTTKALAIPYREAQQIDGKMRSVWLVDFPGHYKPKTVAQAETAAEAIFAKLKKQVVLAIPVIKGKQDTEQFQEFIEMATREFPGRAIIGFNGFFAAPDVATMNVGVQQSMFEDFKKRLCGDIEIDHVHFNAQGMDRNCMEGVVPNVEDLARKIDDAIAGMEEFLEKKEQDDSAKMKNKASYFGRLVHGVLGPLFGQAAIGAGKEVTKEATRVAYREGVKEAFREAGKEGFRHFAKSEVGRQAGKEAVARMAAQAAAQSFKGLLGANAIGGAIVEGCLFGVNTVYVLADDKLTAGQKAQACGKNLVESGASVGVCALSSTIGQILIPVPVLGGVVGGFVGSAFVAGSKWLISRSV